MKRKFRIYKDNQLTIRKWVLTVNGYDARYFLSWHLAIHFLIDHWYCKCLDLSNPEYSK